MVRKVKRCNRIRKTGTGGKRKGKIYRNKRH